MFRKIFLRSNNKISYSKINLNFDTKIGVEYSTTPPKDWYLNPDYLNVEKLTTFNNYWLPIINNDSFNNNNKSYFETFNILKEPIIIVKNEQDTIKCLSNVCRVTFL